MVADDAAGFEVHVRAPRIQARPKVQLGHAAVAVEVGTGWAGARTDLEERERRPVVRTI